MRLDIYVKKIFIVNNFLELKKIFFFHNRFNKPIIILGQGSNVLFNGDFYGSVVINRMKGIKIYYNINFWFIEVASGEIWSDLVYFTINNGIFGLENLAFIPGSVGSGVVNNIGSYGLEIKDFIYYVKIFDVVTGNIFFFNKKQCLFSYRNSIFKGKIYNRFLIIKVILKINKYWKPFLFYKDLFMYFKNFGKNICPKKIYIKIKKIRDKKIPNPLIYGNAGCFFVNPIVDYYFFLNLKKKYGNIFCILYNYIKINKVKLSAAALIDKCNLRGFTVGGASVSKLHSLFLVNTNNASSEDFVSLYKKVRKIVFKKFNIFLKIEVNIIDFFNLKKYLFLKK